jgi:crotonobetainyl-CoA:carnitine CoA-transferase CaiB-like acyl-CoA transferase
MAVGLTGLSAVLMALYARTQTGEGTTIDCSMLGSLAPWSAHIIGAAIAGGPGPRSADQRSLGGAAFYNVYVCADGEHIVLCGREEKFVRALLNALGRADLISLAIGDAGAAQDPVKAFLATTFAARARAHWETWFAGRDIAFAPVRSLDEGLAHAGLILRDTAGAHHIRPAISFAGEDWTPAEPPSLNEH